MGRQHGAWPGPSVLALPYDGREVDIVLVRIQSSGSCMLCPISCCFSCSQTGVVVLPLGEQDVRPEEEQTITMERTWKEPEIHMPTQPGK